MSDIREEEHPREPSTGQFRDKPVTERDPAVAEDLYCQAQGAPQRIVYLSDSNAVDGALFAIADVSSAMEETGLGTKYRVVGGIAVMLHVLRTGVDVPVRGTGDADCGVPPWVLHQGNLVTAIEQRGYTKTTGCRWEREIDDIRTAAVDLLVPAYTSHARSSKQVGDVNTTEIPWLAEAFIAEPCVLDAEFHLFGREILHTTVALPNPKTMLLIKAGARAARNEDRDATDLWRCLEVANADGVTAADYEGMDVATAKQTLLREMGRSGAALEVITRDVSPEEAARRSTRIQALLQRVVGT